MVTASNSVYLDGHDEIIRCLLMELDYEFSNYHWENTEANILAYRAILDAYRTSRIVKNEEVRSTVAYVLNAIAESITNNERLNLYDLLFPEGKEIDNEK